MYAVFNFPYLIEILTPLLDAKGDRNLLLGSFARKYSDSLHAGCGVSVPDNPMGRKRISLLECIRLTGLKVDPEKVVMNLNTFHSKDELDEILMEAYSIGIVKLLVIRGDGGPDLQKLDPASVGGRHSIATTIDVLNYINSSFSGKFQTGVAFNPYKNVVFEQKHLNSKIEAGAKFIITQPLIGQDGNVDAILNQGLPVVVEAWMSTNIELFNKSVGRVDDNPGAIYDPVKNLELLHRAYPDACIYLALLKMDNNWDAFLPRLNK